MILNEAIISKDNPVKLEDVKVGDVVILPDGSEAKITNILNNGVTVEPISDGEWKFEKVEDEFEEDNGEDIDGLVDDTIEDDIGDDAENFNNSDDEQNISDNTSDYKPLDSEILDSVLDKQKEKILEEINKEVVDGESSGKMSDEMLERLSAMFGVDASNKNRWKNMLSKIVKRAAGVKEVYKSYKAHRRYEGAFGAKTSQQDFNSISLIFDLSGSLSMESFVKALKELELVIKDLNRLGVKPSKGYHVVFFGDKAEYLYLGRKFDINIVKSKSNAVRSKIGYGTALRNAFKELSEKITKTDLILVFTDGETYDYSSLSEGSEYQKAFSFYKLHRGSGKDRSKIAYVLVGSKHTRSEYIRGETNVVKVV